MATKSIWRLLTVMSAAVFALAIAASAFAQGPPAPPNTFYGSGATVDGEAAADGAVVTAWNADGEAVGSATITGGSWNIDVDAADADNVTFSIDGSNASASYAVESAAITNVSLALGSAGDDGDMSAVDDGTGDDGTGDGAGDDGDGDDGDMGAGDDGDDGDTGDGDDGDGADAGPIALPDTGSGGLAGGSGLPVLPLALAISVVVALGGVLAVRRTRA